MNKNTHNKLIIIPFDKTKPTSKPIENDMNINATKPATVVNEDDEIVTNDDTSDEINIDYFMSILSDNKIYSLLKEYLFFFDRTAQIIQYFDTKTVITMRQVVVIQVGQLALMEHKRPCIHAFEFYGKQRVRHRIV